MLKQSLRKDTMKAHIAWRTDTGLVRKNNEDNLFVVDISDVPGSPFQCVFAVADGMGGLEKGEVASGIAVKYLHDLFEAQNISAFAGKLDGENNVKMFLEQTVLEINRRICAESRNSESGGGMGTTLTFGVQKGDTLFIAHVGDSRAYLIRGKSMDPITKDHSYVGELVDAGLITEKDAKAHPQRNVISRCLGHDEKVKVDVFARQIKHSDYLLFCSDGLTGMVNDKEIRDIVLREKHPEAAGEKLIDFANERGGVDNITVILAYFQGEASSAPGNHATLRMKAQRGGDSYASRKWQLIALQGVAAVIVGVVVVLLYYPGRVDRPVEGIHVQKLHKAEAAKPLLSGNGGDTKRAQGAVNGAPKTEPDIRDAGVRFETLDSNPAEAKQREVDEVLPTDYGEQLMIMEFVFVKGGEYEMGPDEGRDKKKPAQKVLVSGFYIGKYEVTQAQWQAIMGSNPSKFSSCGPNCPVENVGWEDVQKFIEKMNKATGKTYRLPTESEWEYACRSGGKNENYSGTNDVSRLLEYAWYDNNSGSKPHEVGKKKPNGLGIYDMSGNVWEWCSDRYDNNNYKNGSYKNLQRSELKQSSRVIRGGSWFSLSKAVRAACCGDNLPEGKNGCVGFRLARTP